MISSYKVDFLNSLSSYDVYTHLNCYADDCLRKIAADPDVSRLMMDAALQVLRTRRDVESYAFEWECRARRDEQFRAWVSAQSSLQPAGVKYDI